MPVTFQVVGNLADFGNDPRAGVKVHATASPGVKVGDVAVHSNEPETVVTDAAGAFTLELVSLPGVWYTIRTPYSNAINTVRLAGYTPDAEDPTTGTEFPALTVISLRDVMDEDPTPGYEGLVYSGPPNVLTVGTVTTGAPGSDAAADIGGVSPSQTLDLVIPRGDVGPKGDTGDTGYVGPKGDKGDKGDTGDVGPKGDTGDDSTVPGPPNVLAVGTVTTGAAGTSAAATITGASPVQTLNLTIPRGNTGSPTEFELRGTGSPEGVVTAAVGTYYTDTALTNGALRWAKKTGSGNTGWKVIEGDTGWRDIRSLYSANVVEAAAFSLSSRITRVGNTVQYLGRVKPAGAVIGVARANVAGIQGVISTIPAGFNPLPSDNGPKGAVSQTLTIASQGFLINPSVTSRLDIYMPTNVTGNWAAGDILFLSGSWPTADAWPTTLPGVAA